MKEEKIPVGKWIKGCLCGVSNDSLKDAKDNATDLWCTRIIDEYTENGLYFVTGDNEYWKYSYPVSYKGILGLAKELAYGIKRTMEIKNDKK